MPVIWEAPIPPWVATAVSAAANMNKYVRNNLLFLKQNILLEAPVELTIAGGTITITQTFHTIDTQDNALTDNLDSIGGGAEGRIVILRAEDTDHTVILKNGAPLVLGSDIYLDDINKYVALICDAALNWHLLYSAMDVTFMANAFQYPNPTVEWKPNTGGACLPASQDAKVTYLPLNFLKIGDVIISYNLTGAINGAGATLDCELLQVDLNHPVDTTPIGNGFIAQQSDDAIFDATASVDDKTVATDEMYYLLITGTTGGTDTITVMGAEVLVRRLV